MKLKSVLFVALLFAGFGVKAHDFTATIDGQRLCFDITNKVKRTAALTFNGSITDKKENLISGKVVIPSKIKHENVIYEVTAINPKAFAGAKHLKGVVIPAGVEEIGDFAFEGCDSLASVVFPGNPVTFGQGVFFNCPSIADVTIGSDWKTVDLTMFRWSKQLSSINIPAKVEKIHGIKKLKGLKEITVDSNNDKFSSIDGMLYSKSGKIFYACPRAFAGRVTVAAGTETIIDGALIDCLDVTSLDLPATLQKMPFRETSRMKKLETVVMRPELPIVTAYIGGNGKFLLQVANNQMSIIILSSAKQAYIDAMATEAGEYSETPTSVPYIVTAEQMPTKKNLKGVKNFDKF